MGKGTGNNSGGGGKGGGGGRPHGGNQPAGRGGSSPTRAPNDDRSTVKNPTSPAYGADMANRRGQREGGGS